MTEQSSDHTTDVYALQVQALTKRYGDLVAVDGLTLQIKKGEIFGFLGPNGAGKTTAINMMVGLLSPTGGSVLINGQDRARVPKRSIGICPQEIVLWEELTCVENLTVIGDMYDLPRAVTNERVRSLLADLALSEKANARVSQLSGGVKRRLNVALAVVHDPDIVVLDEPSSGLDPQSRLLLWDFVRSLKGKGKTTILTTHAMEEADALSDRVAIIDHGKLLQLDTPQNLKRTIGSGDIIEMQLAEPERNEAVMAGLKSVEGIQEIKDVGGKINVRALNASTRCMPASQILRFGRIRSRTSSSISPGGGCGSDCQVPVFSGKRAQASTSRSPLPFLPPAIPGRIHDHFCLRFRQS
jgi:ABC-2 type transport system ATP-binding protein